MNKKIISLLLALCVLCASLPTTAFAAGTVGKFKDVSATAYYAEAVQWAVNKGVTSGTTSTTFSPNQKCTRAEAMTFIWRAKGKPEPTTTENPFTDVTADKYYYKAVLWAVENKVTSGTSATTFSPNASCTRGQIVTFLWNAAGKPAASGTTFGDVPSNQYYAAAVAWAVEKKITSGTSTTTFSPNDTCTRAQIVSFLYRESGEKVELEIEWGENTRWTAELAPVQNTDTRVVKNGYTFIDEKGWLVDIQTDEPAYYDQDGNPSKARKRIDVLKAPIEMYTFTRRNIGGGMLPYFNAAEKDIQPIPADGVINTSMPYWTMLGLIPYGGYVENGRIYLPMHFPKHYVPFYESKDRTDELVAEMNSRYENETKYDWRIDVTSIDGKMTAQEKECFDTFNQWRIARGYKPYIFDEQAQILAELYALVQASDDYAKKDAVSNGLKVPSAGFWYMFGTNLHSVLSDPQPKEFSSVAGASFQWGGSYSWPFTAYNPNRDTSLFENNQAAASSGISAAKVCEGFKNSTGHYNSISTSTLAITCGVGTVCVNGGIIACSEVQDTLLGTDPRYFYIPMDVIIRDATTIECPNCGRVYTDVKMGISADGTEAEVHEGRLNGQGISLNLEDGCPFCYIKLDWSKWDRLYR